MNVLVTGGRGFIGRHCVRALKERGHSVRIMSSSGGGPDAVTADVTRPATLPAAVAGMEAVVHTVGIIIERRGESFESVVAQGTRDLVNVCREAKVGRFVYVSALGTRPDARSRYHQTKWAAEEAVRSSGIPFTIFRPSIVFGPEDGFINKMIRMPFVPLPGGGKTKYQPIYVGDLASLIAESLENPSAENRTFDAGGPEIMTYEEMLRTALEVAGRRRPMIPLPMGFMKLLSLIHDPFQRIYPPLALLTKDQFRMLQEDNAGDNSALLAAFPGLRLTPLREGLETYLGRPDS